MHVCVDGINHQHQVFYCGFLIDAVAWVTVTMVTVAKVAVAMATVVMVTVSMVTVAMVTFVVGKFIMRFLLGPIASLRQD